MNGKWYDLQVLSPNNTNFFISISKSGGKTNLRKKEKIITKILNDISKLMVFIYKKEVTPVIITYPSETEKIGHLLQINTLIFIKKTLILNILPQILKKAGRKKYVRNY
ncbi:hypothetical protein J4449_04950 [Candidatus Woesearchaeota archaeon]|nr:hypothetical protein [Candidatus Woesearchaeota archaeon]